jgi:hypothetical protein
MMITPLSRHLSLLARRYPPYKLSRCLSAWTWSKGKTRNPTEEIIAIDDAALIGFDLLTDLWFDRPAHRTGTPCNCSSKRNRQPP